MPRCVRTWPWRSARREPLLALAEDSSQLAKDLAVARADCDAAVLDITDELAHLLGLIRNSKRREDTAALRSALQQVLKLLGTQLQGRLGTQTLDQSKTESELAKIKATTQAMLKKTKRA